VTSRDDALALDSVDELKHFQTRFVQPTDDVIYLDGNSLGMLPQSTRQRLHDFIDDEWGKELVRGWQHWVDLPDAVGDRVGDLIGAAPGQVVVCDTITANIYKLATAVLDAMPGRKVIVTDSGNFPTDRHVLEGVAQRRKGQLRTVPTHPSLGVRPDSLHTYLADDVALVSFSYVDYRTAAIADVEKLTRLAHEAGAVVLWDLSHAAGSIPLGLDELGIDLAVGCTYKYLNAGPGAPGFLYVRRDLQDRLTSPIRGWWSTSDMFAMDDPYEPAVGIRRFLSGSPNIPGIVAVEEGVKLLQEAGAENLRAKSVALTEFLIGLADEWLVPLGFAVASPRDSLGRGGHVALAHEEAYRIGQAAIDVGLIADVRPPNLLRLCPAPLTSSFVDVWDAVMRLHEVVNAGAHRAASSERPKVT